MKVGKLESGRRRKGEGAGMPPLRFWLRLMVVPLHIIEIGIAIAIGIEQVFFDRIDRMDWIPEKILSILSILSKIFR